MIFVFFSRFLALARSIRGLRRIPGLCFALRRLGGFFAEMAIMSSEPIPFRVFQILLRVDSSRQRVMGTVGRIVVSRVGVVRACMARVCMPRVGVAQLRCRRGWRPYAGSTVGIVQSINAVV